MTMASQAKVSKLSLADLPSAWLQQLPEELAEQHEDLLALLRTCTVLRDLVLETCERVQVYLELPIPADEFAVATRSLIRACKHSSNVYLQFGSKAVDAAGDAPLHVPLHTNASACNLMLSSANASAGQALAAIKSVDLSDLHLNSLVPSWLSLTCPHMTSLALYSCHEIDTSDDPACDQLKQLFVKGTAGFYGDLRHLTGLQSLTVDYDNTYPHFLGGCDEIGSHLTQLTQLSILNVVPQLDPLVRRELAPFTFIHDLRLDRNVIDVDMDLLFSMHSLSHLQVYGFELQGSYTDRPCSWTQLSVSELDIGSFARLPLAGVQSIQVIQFDQLTAYLCPDLAETRQAVAAIGGCGGLQWAVGGGMSIANHQGADGACLAAVLPLLSTCPATGFALAEGAPVTAEVLAAIKQHLTSSTEFNVIIFDGCSWAPGVWPLVLPSLPPQVGTVLVWDHMHPEAEASYAVTEGQVIEMCVHATRPVVVKVAHANVLAVGWEQRGEAAMAAAGHKHVTLMALVEVPVVEGVVMEGAVEEGVVVEGAVQEGAAVEGPVVGAVVVGAVVEGVVVEGPVVEGEA